jgi:DsbC/DsbD-like thiol-disulfide interchange protein
VQRTVSACIAGLIWLVLSDAPAAPVAHTHATLHLETQTAPAGATVWAGLHLKMDPGWHTYWKNAGEGGLGQPTKITWKLPPGITAGAIEWPVPEKLPAADSTTYIFHDEATLLIPLKLATDLKPGSVELNGEAKWLECQTACIPGKATVSAKLEIGNATVPSADAPRFEEWRRRLPQTSAGLQEKAS